MAHAGFWPAALDPPRLGQLGHRLGHTRRLGVTQALGKEKGVLLPFEFQKPRPLWDYKGLWFTRFGRKPGERSRMATVPSPQCSGTPVAGCGPEPEGHCSWSLEKSLLSSPRQALGGPRGRWERHPGPCFPREPLEERPDSRNVAGRRGRQWPLETPRSSDSLAGG